MTKTVDYVLTHAQDTLDYIERLEADLRLANTRITELSTPAPLAKKWYQK